MSVYRFYSTEISAGANVGAASTVGNASLVHVRNAGGTARLVTLANAADATIATFTIPANGTLVIAKESTDQLFAANAEVRFNGVMNINPGAQTTYIG
tara:strand:+ start:12998 stop:13291 length:294 start_codon:yes stop_codon:yes gene_type:complete